MTRMMNTKRKPTAANGLELFVLLDKSYKQQHSIVEQNWSLISMPHIVEERTWEPEMEKAMRRMTKMKRKPTTSANADWI
eukprot:467443-Rhodomonas_salina.2